MKNDYRYRQTTTQENLEMQVSAGDGIVAKYGDHVLMADRHWNGFIAGASFAIMALLAVGIVLNLRAMRSEAALKRLYAKENDERQAEICKRARSSGLTISIFTMLLAVIVSGYFNVTVSLTCLACLIVTALAGNFSKLYWNSRI